MSYTVKPLGPDLGQTFVDYLGSLDFHHAPHWSTCFCRFYYTDCTLEEWQGRTGEYNAREAAQAIQAGEMHGYLAFDGELCIGWCLADDASRFIQLLKHTAPIIAGKKVGAVLCYVIRPEYRNKGVARLMLSRALEGFREQGYEAVLALPVDIQDDPQKRYRGTLNMYQEAGFAQIQEHGPVRVMWLELQA